MTACALSAISKRFTILIMCYDLIDQLHISTGSTHHYKGVISLEKRKNPRAYALEFFQIYLDVGSVG